MKQGGGSMRSIVLAVVLAAAISGSAWAQSTDAVCEAGDEIPGSTRSAIESTAVATVNDFIAGRGQALDANRSSRLADDSLADQILPMRIVLAALGDLGDLRAKAAYLVTSGSSTSPEVECGGTEAHPGGALVSVEPEGRLAYVEVTGEAVNNTVGFLVLLAEEGGTWRIDYFYIATARMARVTGEEIGNRARAEREAGRGFNATVLYRTAATMLDRGPYMSLNAGRELDSDFQAFHPPAEIAGSSPWRWEFSGGPETVRLVNPIAIGGKIYLLIDRDAFGPWPTDAAIDRENMRFIKEMLARWPEITRAFPGLVVRATHPDGRHTYTSTWEIGEPLEETGNSET